MWALFLCRGKPHNYIEAKLPKPIKQGVMGGMEARDEVRRIEAELLRSAVFM